MPEPTDGRSVGSASRRVQTYSSDVGDDLQKSTGVGQPGRFHDRTIAQRYSPQKQDTLIKFVSKRNLISFTSHSPLDLHRIAIKAREVLKNSEEI